MSSSDRRGWVTLINARKAHYIVGTRSLCGNWMYLGTLYQDDKGNKQTDCLACIKKLEKINACKNSKMAQTPRSIDTATA